MNRKSTPSTEGEKPHMAELYERIAGSGMTDHGEALDLIGDLSDELARLTEHNTQMEREWHKAREAVNAITGEVARLTERNRALEAHLKGAFKEGYYAGWRERDEAGGYHAAGPEFCWKQSDARHLATDTEAPHA